MESLSSKTGGKQSADRADGAEGAKPAEDKPSPAAPENAPPEKPNYMADVLARHERISNRVNSRK